VRHGAPTSRANHENKGTPKPRVAVGDAATPRGSSPSQRTSLETFSRPTPALHPHDKKRTPASPPLQ